MMLANLSSILEKKKLVIPYDPEDRLNQLKSELRFYRLNDRGLSTDCVMALALAGYAWYYDQEEEYEFSDLIEAQPEGFNLISDIKWAA